MKKKDETKKRKKKKHFMCTVLYALTPINVQLLKKKSAK